MSEELESRKCTYCGGEGATHREHVIPAIYLGMRAYDRNTQWIVDACKECNILAGSSLFFSIPEKATFILKKYNSRYKKILNTPFWLEKDLNQLDYKLRKMIEGTILAKGVLSRRLLYLASVSQYPKDYMRPKWVEEMYKEYLLLQKKKKRRKKDKTL